MTEVLSAVRQSWSRTIEQIQQMRHDSELPEDQEPSQRKRFKANQDYQTRLAGSAASGSAVSAGSGSRTGSIWKRPAKCPRSAAPQLFLGRRGPGGSKPKGMHLSDMQWPTRVGVVQLLPQQAVDFLYQALSDFSDFMDDQPLAKLVVCFLGNSARSA